MTELYLLELNKSKIEELGDLLPSLGLQKATSEVRTGFTILGAGDWYNEHVGVRHYTDEAPIVLYTRHEGDLQKDPNFDVIKAIVKFLECKAATPLISRVDMSIFDN